MVRKPSTSSSSSKPSKQTLRAPRSSSAKSSAKPAGDSDDEARHGDFSPQDPKHQQHLLNIFNDSFKDVLEQETFSTVLQEIKQALFEREFERAFGREEHLQVYAARWSPTRALCYSRVLNDIKEILEQVVVDQGEAIINPTAAGSDMRPQASPEDVVARLDDVALKDQEEDGEQANPGLPNPTLRVLAIGGAAAEIVAFASYLATDTPAGSSQVSGHITLLDVGPWDSVVKSLHDHITKPPVLSKYASAATKAANTHLLDPRYFCSKFVQKDALELDVPGLMKLLRPEDTMDSSIRVGEDGDNPQHYQQSSPLNSPVLITLLFTLNELYTTSGIGKTTKLLRSITAAVCPGSLLLVVDSPGSYSEASVGKQGAKKKYPMQWLLDHTLLQQESRSARRGRDAASVGDGAPGGDINPEKLGKAVSGISNEEAGGSTMDRSGHEEPKPQGVTPQGDSRNNKGTPSDSAEPQKGCTWEKLDAYSHESLWFRIPDTLRYPISLENMRYQIHLYRACKNDCNE